MNKKADSARSSKTDVPYVVFLLPVFAFAGCTLLAQLLNQPLMQPQIVAAIVAGGITTSGSLLAAYFSLVGIDDANTRAVAAEQFALELQAKEHAHNKEFAELERRRTFQFEEIKKEYETLTGRINELTRASQNTHESLETLYENAPQLSDELMIKNSFEIFKETSKVLLPPPESNPLLPKELYTKLKTVRTLCVKVLLALSGDAAERKDEVRRQNLRLLISELGIAIDSFSDEGEAQKTKLRRAMTETKGDNIQSQ